MRAWVLCFLLVAFAGALAVPALGDSILNPVPGAFSCSNDGGAWQWNYPGDGGVPDYAKRLDCDAGDGGCAVVPSNACIKVEERVSNPYGDIFPVTPTLDPINPPPVGPPPTSGPLPPSGPPIPPYPTTPLPAPTSDCVAGTGWDFEHFNDNFQLGGITFYRGYADFQGWTGFGAPGVSPFVDFSNGDWNVKAAPVYGNAVPIHRIQPPGWDPNMMSNIGGDYWRFSQDINQTGSFWVGSMDRRYSWRQQPGEERDTWGETATGYLQSPACTLRARYLTFKIGGSYSLAQRVELEVFRGDPSRYFGLRFGAGKPGDTSAGLGYPTQYTSFPSAPQTITPGDPSAGWILERASTAHYSENDYMQIHVFDLQPFIGQPVRIRIVDDRRRDCRAWFMGSCIDYYSEHINVDDLRFADAPPPGTVWRRHSDGLCGGVPFAGDGCSPDGEALKPLPTWGVTDVHAHPMANISFGGHVFWGDVSDTLDNVYDCTRPLPAIPGPGGRAAITMPARKSLCTLDASIVAIVAGTLMAGCQVLVVVPFVGTALAAACTAVVAGGSAIALATPVVEGTTLHGARKIASGAVKVGLMLADAMIPVVPPDLNLVAAFNGGLIPTMDSTVKGPANSWWPQTEDWHSNTGLNKTHNMYQMDMLLRAYQGGLRLGVWDVINSRAFALVNEGRDQYTDWQALKDGTDAAQRLVSGPLSSFAQIAYSPAQASSIIRSGKMAVILGSEVDELGKMRPQGLPFPNSPSGGGPDSMQKQIDDLWSMGIRKITPVHAINNPIGGAGLFTTIYDVNNFFDNNTNVQGEPGSGNWLDWDFSIIHLGPEFPLLFQGMVLGQISLFRQLLARPAPPWNPSQWFDFDIGPQLDNIVARVDSVTNDYGKVTYRIGSDKPSGSALSDGQGNWLPPQQVLGKQVFVPILFDDLSWVLGGLDSIGSSNCSLKDNTMPVSTDTFDNGGTVDQHYVAVAGHRNPLGLYRADGVSDGEAFLRAAMKKGMLIDMDHLSQNMRVDVYNLAHQYATEAGYSSGDCGGGYPCNDYPLVSVHSKVRGLEISPSNVEEYRNAYGQGDETSRTEREIGRVAANHGALAVYPTGSAFIPPNTPGGMCHKDVDCANYDGTAGVCAGGICQGLTSLPPRNYDVALEVANDCDFSSKTFAAKYLFMMQRMGGHGLTPATDFNGLNTVLQSRFGWSNMKGNACGGGGARSNTDLARTPSCTGSIWAQGCWPKLMMDGQHGEYSGVWYDEYNTRGPVPEGTDPGYSPSRYKRVSARGVGEVREDRAPKHAVVDTVWYNDHGPDSLSPAYRRGDPAFQTGNRPGAQMFSMKRWRRIVGRAGWDFNVDGLQHIGLYPDLFQDMHNVGVQWEQMGPLFHSAQDYLDTWQRAVDTGNRHP